MLPVKFRMFNERRSAFHREHKRLESADKSVILSILQLPDLRPSALTFPQPEQVVDHKLSELERFLQPRDLKVSSNRAVAMRTAAEKGLEFRLSERAREVCHGRVARLVADRPKMDSVRGVVHLIGRRQGNILAKQDYHRPFSRATMKIEGVVLFDRC